MKRPGVLEELVDKLGQALPPGAAELKADFDKNAKATLQTALGKMDLVTREEFDLQVALLEKTREKLDRLEKLLDSQGKSEDGSG